MDVHRPRVATAAMFFVSGAVIGTWAANVPFVRDRLDVSMSTIGACLLAMAGGSVLAMLRVGHELDRRSSASMTRLGAALVPLAGTLPLLAPSPVTLALALCVLGIAIGVLDVSMNAHGVAVERQAGTPIMSSLHGGWSLGGIAGAGAVALGHVLGVDPRVETAVVCAALLAVGAWFGPRLGSASAASRSVADGTGAGVRLAWPSRGALVIGTLSMLLFMAEGAVTDWSALYLDRDLRSDEATAAIGYAGFAAGMALGRFTGDPINRRIGATRLLRCGAALAALSLALMLLVGEPLVALPALVLVGLGVANGVPLLFSAAGRVRDMPPGPAVAAVSTMSYFGLLAGPPILGFLADLTSLPAALSLTAALTATVAAFAARAER